MSIKHHGIGGGTVTTYAAFDRYGLVPEKKPDSLRSSEQEPKKGSNLLQLSTTPFNLEIRDDWRVTSRETGKSTAFRNEYTEDGLNSGQPRTPKTSFMGSG